MLKLVDLAAKKILLITPTLDINPWHRLAVSYKDLEVVK